MTIAAAEVMGHPLSQSLCLEVVLDAWIGQAWVMLGIPVYCQLFKNAWDLSGGGK